MVYITGDTHGEWNRFSIDNFPEQKDMTRDDYIIVCGDFGIWNDDKTERWWLKWLSEKSFTVLFVDGNHENFDRLFGEEFDVVEFHGGMAHKIRENIYHLMRGYVFELCGKKFFTFGGARSHDISDGVLYPEDYASRKELFNAYRNAVSKRKLVRIKNLSWWEQEMPTQEEMKRGMDALSLCDNSVDFIVTHCCPSHIASVFSMGMYKPDELTSYFNMVAETVKFSKWFFGHYHDNRVIMSKFVMLYEQIIRVV